MENSAIPALKKYWISQMNGSGIRKIVQEHKGQKICGILFKNQLNRPIEGNFYYDHIPVKRKTSFTKITMGIALTFSFIHSYPVQAIKNNRSEISITDHPQKSRRQKKKSIPIGKVKPSEEK